MDASKNDLSPHNEEASGSVDSSTESLKNEYQYRETQIRTWIARNESICPYAPGLAKFTYLPLIKELDFDFIRYLSSEMKSFYDHRKNGEKVERWMMLPYRDWENHLQAKDQCEKLFWALQASYYYLRNDRTRMKQALEGSMPGYHKDQNGDISNPIIGHLAKKPCDKPHAKSLFCTGLSNLYRYEKHHRYAPHSVMVMVYASDFCEKKNDKALQHINVNIAHGCLLETFGLDLEIDIKKLKAELPIWEHIIGKVLFVQGYRDQKVLNAEVMDIFRNSPDFLVDQILQQTYKAIRTYEGQSLGIVKMICEKTQMRAKDVIGSHFTGTGLYVLPAH